MEARGGSCGALPLATGAFRCARLTRDTEHYDRGEKLSNYKQLPSLRVVLFVSHRRPHVTLVVRVEGGWDVRELRMGEEVVLEFSAPFYGRAVRRAPAAGTGRFGLPPTLSR